MSPNLRQSSVPVVQSSLAQTSVATKKVNEPSHIKRQFYMGNSSKENYIARGCNSVQAGDKLNPTTKR